MRLRFEPNCQCSFSLPGPSIQTAHAPSPEEPMILLDVAFRCSDCGKPWKAKEAQAFSLLGSDGKSITARPS